MHAYLHGGQAPVRLGLQSCERAGGVKAPARQIPRLGERAWAKAKGESGGGGEGDGCG